MLTQPKAILNHKTSFYLTWWTESQKAEYSLQELTLDIVKTHSYSPVHSGEGEEEGGDWVTENPGAVKNGVRCKRKEMQHPSNQQEQSTNSAFAQQAEIYKRHQTRMLFV